MVTQYKSWHVNYFLIPSHQLSENTGWHGNSHSPQGVVSACHIVTGMSRRKRTKSLKLHEVYLVIYHTINNFPFLQKTLIHKKDNLQGAHTQTTYVITCKIRLIYILQVVQAVGMMVALGIDAAVG